MSMLLKSRARLVCVQCHERKIKCDLQQSLGSSCTHCLKHKIPCIRREGVRKRNRPSGRRAQRRSQSASPVVDARPDTSYAPSDAAPSELHEDDISPAYIAEHSVLQDADYELQPGALATTPPVRQITGGITTETKAKILRATDAHKLPKPALKQALFDAFFANLGYAYPIIDRAEVESPDASVLLQQVVCLAGSMMRHPNLPESIPRSRTIYEKVKILICLNFESNMLVVLKVLCLMTLWSPVPSHIVSLDGPWHATGSALRLAVQMGMHRKSTYAGKPDRSCRRRLWWLLYGSDSVQALIYGRIPVLKPEDFDVAPLTEGDFDEVSVEARNFIADASLARVMGDLASKISRNMHPDSDKVPIAESLSTWMAQLHPDLHLYDGSGRRTPYRYPVIELHIEYLGTVILSQAFSRQFSKQWPCSTACLIAATCIASLYEEVLYREQVALLITMHAFWCLTAAIPLLYYKPETAAMEAQRKESLDILMSVVEQLRPRFGLAKTVAHKIERLQRERRDILSQQIADQNKNAAQVSSAQQGEETQQLHGFFPQLRAWSTIHDTGTIQNAILEGVAQTHAIHGVQGSEPLVQWISEGPLSIFDALGASSFMDTFFDDTYHGDEMDFDLAGQV